MPHSTRWKPALLLICTFCLGLSQGCQTVVRDFKMPIGTYKKDQVIEKVLARDVIKFQFYKTPHLDDKYIQLECLVGNYYEGKRHLKIAHGQSIIDYSGWREFIEIPFLAPLSTIFLPFNLIGWALGFNTSKLQAVNTFRFYHPGQNGAVWETYYSYEEKTGPMTKVKWFEWKDVDTFEITSFRVGDKEMAVEMPKVSGKRVAVIPIKEMFPEAKLPILLHIQAKVNDKLVDGKIMFTYDDTPRYKKKAPAKDTPEFAAAEKVIQGYFKVASFYYEKRNYQKALEFYGKVIGGYRWLYTILRGFPPEHQYYRALLFRGLSRIRLYSPKLQKLEQVPTSEAWRAMGDLETFVQLAPWNPLVGFVQVYLRPLARRVLGIKGKPGKKDGKKREKKG